MSISNYLEDAILDAVFNNTSLAVATVYLSLHDGDPGEAGANEITGGSYARQAAAFDDASGGETANSDLEQWTDMPIANVAYVGTWDAVSAGNFLWGGPLAGGAFTAANTGDVFTDNGHGMSNGQRIMFYGSSLPTGISAGTVYFVVNADTNTFQVSATEGGSAVTLSADGSGNYIKVKYTNAGDTFQIAAGDLEVSID